MRIKGFIEKIRIRADLIAEVVKLVYTLPWGGSGASRAGSSPAFGTILPLTESFLVYLNAIVYFLSLKSKLPLLVFFLEPALHFDFK